MNPPGNPPRILVVEDDEIVAALTTEMLGTAGDVEWAANAERAIELLNESDFDLVVVDIGLPGMSGLDLVKEVKRISPLAATLILTGDASFDNAVEAMRAGAEDFMSKPVDGAELVAKVGELDCTRVPSQGRADGSGACRRGAPGRRRDRGRRHPSTPRRPRGYGGHPHAHRRRARW